MGLGASSSHEWKIKSWGHCDTDRAQYKYAVYEKTQKGENAKELARTVIHFLSPFKEHVKSITTDNGTEFACHEMIGKSLGVTIYFADPYASW